MSLKKILIIWGISGAVIIILALVAVVNAAEYTIQVGDGWEKITKAVNKVSGGIKYSSETLLIINPGQLKPGQKIKFLTKKEWIRAHDYVKWCAAGEKENLEPYRTDLANFKTRIIRADSIPHLIDYAGYKFGPRRF